MAQQRDDPGIEQSEPGPSNPITLGIDPEMAWLVVHDPVAYRDKLTWSQHQATALLADILDPERVDHVLALKRGTVREWAKDENFRAETQRRRFELARERPVMIEAVLTPAQQRAAYMEASGAKKVEIAETLGCHRSTIHNWGNDPAYRRLVRRLAKAICDQRAEEDRRAREEELRLAHDTIVRALREDDLRDAARLALSVVRTYELDIERMRRR